MTDDPPEFVAWNTAIARARWAYAFRRARIEEYCPLCGNSNRNGWSVLCWRCRQKRRVAHPRKGKA
jgi:transposase-like protein